LHRRGLSRNEPRLKTARLLRAAVAVFSLVPMRTGLSPRQIQKGVKPSGAKKRFKITGTGKVVYAQRGKRHGMIKRTPKQIRDLRGTSILFKTDGDKVKKFFLPNG
jgi:large subunit ribosomal protein L35